MQIIPSNSYPNFTEETVLSDEILRVSFSWNSRGAFWTVTIRDRDQNILLAGVKLVMGLELIARYAGIELPRGEYVCVRKTGTLEKITQDEMGTDVDLVFASEAELATF